MLDQNHASHDIQSKQRIKADVEKFGFHIAQIPSDGYSPSFYYSIGFYQTYGKPEIVVFALPSNTVQHIFAMIEKLYQNGETIKPYQNYSDFIDGLPIQFLPVERVYYQYYFGYGSWFYQNEAFPMLELVWTDKAGKFPFEEGFNKEWQYLQPLMDRNTDFLFNEPKNLATFTEPAILNGKPILEVYHDFEGDWQFVTGQELNDDDKPKMVSLDCMVKLDPTLNEVHYLNYGEVAKRLSMNDEWVISTMEKSEDNE